MNLGSRTADSPERPTARSTPDRDRISPSAEVILDAAEALFGQRGYAATSVAAICTASARFAAPSFRRTCFTCDLTVPLAM